MSKDFRGAKYVCYGQFKQHFISLYCKGMNKQTPDSRSLTFLKIVGPN